MAPPAPTLDAFQREFAAALLGEPTGDAGRALAAQPGFAVYRNTVLQGCIDALAANFPTVATLVGREWFDEAAGRFARAELPREGSLAAYGAAFAAFLERLEGTADLAYLGGVARLDRAWTESHLAADAPVLQAAALAALEPAELLDAVLVPHPAARWVVSPELPVYAIWRRHRERASLDDALAWQGDGGLLTRPAASVLWQALGAPAAAFLDACAEDRPFAAAAARACPVDAVAADRIDAWLPALVAAGAFTRVARPAP
jgi:hypothetical protein